MKTQRKQYLVKLISQAQGNEFIKFLEANGYYNSHNIKFENMHIKVLVIDEKSFFTTNATCLAAAVNCGIKCISVEEFKKLINANQNNLSK